MLTIGTEPRYFPLTIVLAYPTSAMILIDALGRQRPREVDGEQHGADDHADTKDEPGGLFNDAHLLVVRINSRIRLPWSVMRARSCASSSPIFLCEFSSASKNSATDRSAASALGAYGAVASASSSLFKCVSRPLFCAMRSLS